MDTGDSFFGGTTYKQLGLLSPEQSGLLGSMIQNYGSLNERAGRMQSSYQGAPEEYFQNSILNPQRALYNQNMAALNQTGKRHSSFTNVMRNKANQQYLTGIGQMHSDFLNQERLREMQGINDLRNQQAALYGLANQVGGLALNRDTFENIAQQDSGILGKISGLMNLGGSIGSMFTGGIS